MKSIDYASPPPSLDVGAGGAARSENTRIGLVLFLVYLHEYVGFILLCAFAKETMAQPSLGGMNFAVVCGFGLIIEAFVLALIYMAFCKPDPTPEITEGELAEEAQKEEGSA